VLARHRMPAAIGFDDQSGFNTSELG